MSSQSEDFDPVSASQEEEEEAEEEIEEEEQCQEEGGKEIYEENVGEEEEVVEAHFGKRFHEELDSDEPHPRLKRQKIDHSKHTTHELLTSLNDKLDNLMEYFALQMERNTEVIMQCIIDNVATKEELNSIREEIKLLKDQQAIPHHLETSPEPTRHINKKQEFFWALNQYIWEHSRRKLVRINVHMDIVSGYVLDSKEDSKDVLIEESLRNCLLLTAKDVFQFFGIPDDSKITASANDPLADALEYLIDAKNEKKAQKRIHKNWMKKKTDSSRDQVRPPVGAIDTNNSNQNYPSFLYPGHEENYTFRCSGKPDVSSLYCPLKLEIKPGKGGGGAIERISDKEYDLLNESLKRVAVDFAVNEGLSKSACLASVGNRAWFIVADRQIFNRKTNESFINETYHFFRIDPPELPTIWYTWTNYCRTRPDFYRMAFLPMIREALDLLGYRLAYSRCQIKSNSESSMIVRIVPGSPAGTSGRGGLDIIERDGYDSFIIKIPKDAERAQNECNVLLHLWNRNCNAVDYVRYILNLDTQEAHLFDFEESNLAPFSLPARHPALHDVFRPDEDNLSEKNIKVGDYWFSFPALSPSSSTSSSSNPKRPPLIVMREGTPVLSQLKMGEPFELVKRIHNSLVLHTDLRITNIMWFKGQSKKAKKETTEATSSRPIVETTYVPRIIDFDLAEILKEGENAKKITVNEGARMDFLLRNEVIKEGQWELDWDRSLDVAMLTSTINSLNQLVLQTPMKEFASSNRLYMIPKKN